ncbi:MAG: VOC family protein [Chloroflexi bacterium]|nr:VOC family protein [Chloroflexota bacterium]
MAGPTTLGVHHLRFTVSDLDRSIAFYTDVLGFELRIRFGPNSVFLHDGTVGLGLNTPWHELSPEEERFDEARVGLDHVGFRVASADDVHKAAEHLDAHGIAHSEVKPGRIPDSLLVVFRDPDNIQLEYYFTP